MVPPSVLDGLQLQVNPKTLFFYFISAPVYPIKQALLASLFISQLQLECDEFVIFPVSSASFPLKWVGICRLSCSWTPWFFYSLC